MKSRLWGLGLVFALAGWGSAGAENLQTLIQDLKAQVWWEPYRQIALLSSSDHQITLHLQAGLGLIDGQEVLELPSLVVNAQGIELSARDLALIRRALDKATPGLALATPEPRSSSTVSTSAATSLTNRHIQVFVLDAGHGGSDPGSIAEHTLDGRSLTLKEKDLTLAVVLETEKLLKQRFPDRTIVLTRRIDAYPTLEERVRLAHAQKLGDKESILFLSVHFNASLNKKAHGLEFWYVPQDFERDVLGSSDLPESVFPVLNALVDSEFKKESHDLAANLADSFAKELGDSQIQRGLKENPWFVVRMTHMPAVLAELGFLTNPEEARRLNDPEYLKKLAHGLYTGLVAFIQHFEDGS